MAANIPSLCSPLKSAEELGARFRKNSASKHSWALNDLIHFREINKYSLHFNSCYDNKFFAKGRYQ